MFRLFPAAPEYPERRIFVRADPTQAVIEDWSLLVRLLLFGFDGLHIEDSVGLVGATWLCAMMWAGEPYLQNGSAMSVGATLVAAAVAFPLWRINVRVGAICLVVGCLGGPPALIGLLAYSISIGAPL